MKHVPNLPTGIEPDADDQLFDTRVRAAMALFTPGEDTSALEAAAAVRTAAHAVERLRSRGGESRGLSSGALDVLIRLSVAAGTGTSIGELGRSAGMSARNATGLVDTLERDGLVRRIQDPDDRRSVRAVITPAGRERVEAFREPTRRAMAALFAGLTDTERAELRHLALRLVANQRAIERHLAGGAP